MGEEKKNPSQKEEKELLEQLGLDDSKRIGGRPPTSEEMNQTYREMGLDYRDLRQSALPKASSDKKEEPKSEDKS